MRGFTILQFKKGLMYYVDKLLHFCVTIIYKTYVKNIRSNGRLKEPK